jgi:hypothetical protein
MFHKKEVFDLCLICLVGGRYCGWVRIISFVLVVVRGGGYDNSWPML